MADISLYFAYGSNMDTEQMIDRCPTAKFFSRAYLPNHELVFRGRSVAWGGGVATIVPTPGATVPGVVYAMKRRDLSRLDEFEGHPIVYQREQRVVHDTTNTWWRAHTYAMLEGDLNPPSKRYLKKIMDAYDRFGFSRESLPRGTRVFVYGTLLSGEPNHQLIEKAIYVGEAHTPPVFDMIDLGSFPAVVFGGRTSVKGEIYEVDELTLARLDRLEGHPQFYRRERVLIGNSECWVYVLPARRGRALIASGDWRAERT